MILGVIGMMFLFVSAVMSSCSVMMSSLTSSGVLTTYPSADADMLAAEAQYLALEAELQEYLDNYESTHDYDEYHFDLDEIEHDPYVLISMLTALWEGEWTIDEVGGLLQTIFDRRTLTADELTNEMLLFFIDRVNVYSGMRVEIIYRFSDEIARLIEPENTSE